MRILKCLSWFKMSTHIKDYVSFESCAFVDVGVRRNVVSLSEISAVNLIIGL